MLGRSRVGMLLAAAVVLGGCSDASTPAQDGSTAAPAATSSSNPGPGGGTASSLPSSTEASTVPPAPSGPVEQIPLAWERVGDGFENPLAVLAHPITDATLVVEQAGRVRSLDGEVLLDISDRVAFGGERGLLGAAFHPEADRLFLHYSAAGTGATTLSSLPVAADGSILADETVLFTVDQPAANHNGGSVLFGPDGMLYLALGDGGRGNDAFGTGQDPSSVLGSLLRLDVDAELGSVVPADGNPHLQGGGAPEVWAIGLRNPYRIWFHEGRLVIADVGQDAFEEINVVASGEPGRNYGWPAFEGTACLQGPCDLDAVVPVATHGHDEGWCSVIGGVVVDDPSLPELADVYLYSDLCQTGLHGIVLQDPVRSVAFESGQLPASPLGFGLDAAGRVHVGTADGTVLRLVRG